MRLISNSLWDFSDLLDLEALGPSVATDCREDILGANRPRLFFPSGREAIASALASLALCPEDEVLITNSSGQTYIVSCVTCTVFNYCKPARVLTDTTRAILIIHEYGVPHPQLKELLAVAAERGIPVIEDCAHAFDSRVDGKPIGSFGTYAVYSQPKSLPVQCGGILVGANLDAIANQPDPVLDASLRAEFERHAHLLPYLSKRRRDNFRAVRQAFADLPVLFECGPEVTPFVIGLRTREAMRIRHEHNAVAWASTMDQDMLLIPTNPLVSSGQLVQAVRGAFAPQHMRK